MWADNIFYSITFSCIIFFTLEVILASYAKPDYIYSFFFWLDIVSILSMIPDVGWFWDVIIGTNSSSKSAFELAKTSKSGRVTRVIRIIRLIRLIRIVKLYKQS
jgi:hypothetical protein